VLAGGTPVAVTIDGDEMPHPVLMIPSSANVSSVK
jgi:hypothetical protein